jgi:serine/threonine-protein kinase
VLDFGMALQPGTAQEWDLAALGSPEYVSPEQLESAATVDARSDVWSLGVVLYELLTGKLPFRSDTFEEARLFAGSSAPVPPSRLRPDVPPELDRIVLRCLMKPRQLRFANARDLGLVVGLVAQRLAATGGTTTTALGRVLSGIKHAWGGLARRLRPLGELMQRRPLPRGVALPRDVALLPGLALLTAIAMLVGAIVSTLAR